MKRKNMTMTFYCNKLNDILKGDITLLVHPFFKIGNSNRNFASFENESLGDDGHIVANQIVAIDSKESHQEDEEIEQEDGIK